MARTVIFAGALFGVCATAVMASSVMAQQVDINSEIEKAAERNKAQWASDVTKMTEAVAACDYDKWAAAKTDYDALVDSASKGYGGRPSIAAPPYPIPCKPKAAAVKPKPPAAPAPPCPSGASESCTSENDLPRVDRRRVQTEFDRKLRERLRTGKRPEPEEERVEIGSSGRTWMGPYLGGSFGGRGTTETVSNEGQVTFFLPDARPNPTMSNNRTAFYGHVVTGYNSVVALGGMSPPLVLGIEGFVGTASGSGTMRGIPGTGGIATPAVMANDSVTVKEVWDAGILGRFGTIVSMPNTPVSVSLLAGVGFLRVNSDANCTAAGACGTNGIPAQMLSVSNTLVGSLVGFEVGMPAASVFGMPKPADSPVARVLRTANIRAQFLHGDFGHGATAVGNPAQIQLILDQKVTTNTFTVGFVVPLSGYDEIKRSQYARLDHKF